MKEELIEPLKSLEKKMENAECANECLNTISKNLQIVLEQMLDDVFEKTKKGEVNDFEEIKMAVGKINNELENLQEEIIKNTDEKKILREFIEPVSAIRIGLSKIIEWIKTDKVFLENLNPLEDLRGLKKENGMKVINLAEENIVAISGNDSLEPEVKESLIESLKEIENKLKSVTSESVNRNLQVALEEMLHHVVENVKNIESVKLSEGSANVREEVKDFKVTVKEINDKLESIENEILIENCDEMNKIIQPIEKLKIGLTNLIKMPMEEGLTDYDDESKLKSSEKMIEVVEENIKLVGNSHILPENVKIELIKPLENFKEKLNEIKDVEPKLYEIVETLVKPLQTLETTKAEKEENLKMATLQGLQSSIKKAQEEIFALREEAIKETTDDDHPRRDKQKAEVLSTMIKSLEPLEITVCEIIENLNSVPTSPPSINVSVTTMDDDSTSKGFFANLENPFKKLKEKAEILQTAYLSDEILKFADDKISKPLFDLQQCVANVKIEEGVNEAAISKPIEDVRLGIEAVRQKINEKINKTDEVVKSDVELLKNLSDFLNEMTESLINPILIEKDVTRTDDSAKKDKTIDVKSEKVTDDNREMEIKEDKSVREEKLKVRKAQEEVCDDLKENAEDKVKEQFHLNQVTDAQQLESSDDVLLSVIKSVTECLAFPKSEEISRVEETLDLIKSIEDLKTKIEANEVPRETLENLIEPMEKLNVSIKQAEKILEQPSEKLIEQVEKSAEEVKNEINNLKTQSLDLKTPCEKQMEPFKISTAEEIIPYEEVRDLESQKVPESEKVVAELINVIDKSVACIESKEIFQVEEVKKLIEPLKMIKVKLDVSKERDENFDVVVRQILHPIINVEKELEKLETLEQIPDISEKIGQICELNVTTQVATALNTEEDFQKADDVILTEVFNLPLQEFKVALEEIGHLKIIPKDSIKKELVQTIDDNLQTIKDVKILAEDVKENIIEPLLDLKEKLEKTNEEKDENFGPFKNLSASLKNLKNALEGFENVEAEQIEETINLPSAIKLMVNPLLETRNEIAAIQQTIVVEPKENKQQTLEEVKEPLDKLSKGIENVLEFYSESTKELKEKEKTLEIVPEIIQIIERNISIIEKPEVIDEESVKMGLLEPLKKIQATLIESKCQEKLNENFGVILTEMMTPLENFENELKLYEENKCESTCTLIEPLRHLKQNIDVIKVQTMCSGKEEVKDIAKPMEELEHFLSKIIHDEEEKEKSLIKNNIVRVIEKNVASIQECSIIHDDVKESLTKPLKYLQAEIVEVVDNDEMIDSKTIKIIENISKPFTDFESNLKMAEIVLTENIPEEKCKSYLVKSMENLQEKITRIYEETEKLSGEKNVLRVVEPLKDVKIELEKILQPQIGKIVDDNDDDDSFVNLIDGLIEKNKKVVVINNELNPLETSLTNLQSVLGDKSKNDFEMMKVIEPLKELKNDLMEISEKYPESQLITATEEIAQNIIKFEKENAVGKENKEKSFDDIVSDLTQPLIHLHEGLIKVIGGKEEVLTNLELKKPNFKKIPLELIELINSNVAQIEEVKIFDQVVRNDLIDSMSNLKNKISAISQSENKVLSNLANVVEPFKKIDESLLSLKQADLNEIDKTKNKVNDILTNVKEAKISFEKTVETVQENITNNLEKEEKVKLVKQIIEPLEKVEIILTDIIKNSDIEIIKKTEGEQLKAKTVKELEDKKLKEEEESKAKKQKEEEESKAKKQKEEEEQNVKSQKEEEGLKAKKQQEEDELKAKKLKEEEELKVMKLKEEEEELKAKKQKEEEELKVKKQQEEEKLKVEKQKEEEELKVKKLKEEEEVNAKKKNEEKELKAKTLKEEEELKAKKQKEEEELSAKKQKEEEELKAKKLKEEEELKAKKQKEEEELKAKKLKEEEELKAKKKKEEEELKAKKQKEEEEELKAKKLKEEQDKLNAQKLKEEEELKAKKQKEEEEHKAKKQMEEEELKTKKLKEEEELKAKKLKNEEEKLKAKKQKEEEELKVKKQKEEEQKAKKQKEDEESKARKTKEKEEKLKAKKQKEEEEVNAKKKKEEKELKAKKLKEEEELNAKKQKEKEEEELKAKKQKEEEELEAKKQKEEEKSKTKKLKEEEKIKDEKEVKPKKKEEEEGEVKTKKQKETKSEKQEDEEKSEKPLEELITKKQLSYVESKPTKHADDDEGDDKNIKEKQNLKYINEMDNANDSNRNMASYDRENRFDKNFEVPSRPSLNDYKLSTSEEYIGSTRKHERYNLAEDTSSRNYIKDNFDSKNYYSKRERKSPASSFSNADTTHLGISYYDSKQVSIRVTYFLHQ